MYEEERMNMRRISRNIAVLVMVLGQMGESLAIPPNSALTLDTHSKSIVPSESREENWDEISHKIKQEDWDICIKYIDKNKHKHANPHYMAGSYLFNQTMQEQGHIPNEEFVRVLGDSYEIIRKDLPNITRRSKNCLPKTIEEALESGKLDGIKQEIYLENFLETITNFGIMELEAFSLKGGPFKISTKRLSKALWEKISQKACVGFGFENKKWEEIPRRQDLEKILEECGMEKLEAAVQNRVNVIRKSFVQSSTFLLDPLWRNKLYTFADLLSPQEFSKFRAYYSQEEGEALKNGFDLDSILSPSCKAILGEDAIKTVQENTELLGRFKNSIKKSLSYRNMRICNKILREVQELPASIMVQFLSPTGDILNSETLKTMIWKTIVTSWKNWYTGISEENFYDALKGITSPNERNNPWDIHWFEGTLMRRKNHLKKELLRELPSRVATLSSLDIDLLLEAFKEDTGEVSKTLAQLIYENSNIYTYISKFRRIVSLNDIKDHLDRIDIKDHHLDHILYRDSLKTAIQNRRKVLMDQAQEEKALPQNQGSIKEILMEEEPEF